MTLPSRKTLTLLAALSYSILLFFVAAYLPKITNKLAEILTWVVYSQVVRGLVTYLLAIFAYLIFIRWAELPRRFLFLLVLAVFGVLTFFFISRLGDSVNEYVHYPQYATLVCLWYPALSQRRSARGRLSAVLRRPLPAAAIVSSVFGILEEGSQYFLPGRVFDLQDILLNLMGVWLGLMVIWTLAGDGSSGLRPATSHPGD
ncbi:MAG: VanZ family protein [Candidatus Glassbacteria bacterium]